MTYLDDADFRYLGKPINTESSEVDCRRLNIEEKLRSLLEALDTDTLTASAKIWLYHPFVASKLSWSLLINDLCLNYPLSKSCKPLPPNHSSGGSGFQSAPTLRFNLFCWWPRSVWSEGPQSHHTLEAATAHQAQPARILLGRALPNHR